MFGKIIFMKERIGLMVHWLGFLIFCFFLVTGLYGSITLYEDENILGYISWSILYYLFIYFFFTGIGWLIRKSLVGKIPLEPWKKKD